MAKSAVQAAFEKHVVVLPLNIIVPQKVVTKGQREGDFYRQITASLKHVGLIEPLIVYPRGPGEYLLLEGHVRLEILKSLGVTEAKWSLVHGRRSLHVQPPCELHSCCRATLHAARGTEERVNRRAYCDRTRRQHRVHSGKTRHAERSLPRGNSGAGRQAGNPSGVFHPQKDEGHPAD